MNILVRGYLNTTGPTAGRKTPEDRRTVLGGWSVGPKVSSTVQTGWAWLISEKEQNRLIWGVQPTRVWGFQDSYIILFQRDYFNKGLTLIYNWHSFLIIINIGSPLFISIGICYLFYPSIIIFIIHDLYLFVGLYHIHCRSSYYLYESSRAHNPIPFYS